MGVMVITSLGYGKDRSHSYKMATVAPAGMFEEEERGKGRTSTSSMSYFVFKATISPEFLEAFHDFTG